MFTFSWHFIVFYEAQFVSHALNLLKKSLVFLLVKFTLKQEDFFKSYLTFLGLVLKSLRRIETLKQLANFI